MEVIPVSSHTYNNQNELDYEYDPTLDEDNEPIVSALSKRLEEELRAAKRTHLSCGEVLLPCGLLQRISRDVLVMADSEPCGLRGCTLYFNFASDEDSRRLSTVKCDPYTASTFELYLTLKENPRGWDSFLPQFLKKITRGGTVMISSEYELTKKKLYRSYVD
ncbi:protein charybde-like [Agrilus planipennis]|uniref:Protein charybde-like n=1 Tax=Agrilus planipennis TaxID=224129 RepID=A0A7F5RM47_AGRPL|nr:protein charybde-like [Agrilus planipennis]